MTVSSFSGTLLHQESALCIAELGNEALHQNKETWALLRNLTLKVIVFAGRARVSMFSVLTKKPCYAVAVPRELLP